MRTVAIRFDHPDLWRTRAYYMLWYGGMAFVAPFLNLYYLQIGLTGTQIGAIASISSIVTLFAAPFWMSRYDGWKQPARALEWFMVLNAVGLFLLSQQAVFLGVAVVSLFRAFVTAGISPLSDAMSLNVTGNIRGAGFGSVRVFGSLGWIICVIIGGWVVEKTDLHYSLIGGGILTLSSVIMLTQISPGNFTHQVKGVIRPPIRQIFKKIMMRPMLLGMTFMIIIVGISNSGVQQFQMTYMDHLGASASLIGIASMIGAVVELPIMIWTDHLMKKHSPYRLLLISMILYIGIRSFVFLLPSVPSIMLAQAIQGLAFSFYTIPMIRLIQIETTPGETRMMLAFFTVTLVSFTSIVGAPIAGIFFDAFGAHGLYLIAVCGFALAWIALQAAGHVSARLGGKFALE
jgi:PPP family 3-phenylpropionic acid transporter